MIEKTSSWLGLGFFGSFWGWDFVLLGPCSLRKRRCTRTGLQERGCVLEAKVTVGSERSPRAGCPLMGLDGRPVQLAGFPTFSFVGCRVLVESGSHLTSVSSESNAEGKLVQEEEFLGGSNGREVFQLRGR